MPKIERVFEDTNAKVNPHLNPFVQLTDNVTAPAQKLESVSPAPA